MQTRPTSLSRKAWLALCCLTLQYSMLVLVIRRASVATPRLSVSVAVMLSELLKFVLAWLLHRAECEPCAPPLHQVLFAPQWHLALVPAVLYTIQNMLQYLALEHMDAASYQVTYQLKLVATAVCAVRFLHTSLSRTQWFALALLTLGIMLVQWPADTAHGTVLGPGLLYVLAACVLSGATGVYVESLLKASTQLWPRTMQLAFFAMCSLSWVPFHESLAGFGAWAALAIVCQAAVGLLVALVMKHASTLLKAFATSLSIVLSSCISILLHDIVCSWHFVLGALLVLLATFLYGHRPSPAPSSKRQPVIPMYEVVERSESGVTV